jgi:glycosyltransferase involved in cell wall biosynthesis
MLLMVGTLEPRKGHLQALQACSLLWQAGVQFNLLLVGAEGWQGVNASERGPVVELLKALRGHAHWQRRLFWLEDVDDQQLATLYARADGLLAASWDEGFGLPLIEAARFGLPALARDIPVFREVTGGRARFFQAGTPGELARALRLWLADGMMPRPGTTYWPGWEQSAARLIEYCLAEPRQ